MTIQSEDMGKLVATLVDAVEGPPGYGTLRNADGVRLKDHPAWVSVYLAAKAFRPAHREAQPETDGGGERDYPAEFEAWWATYKHRNRDVASYPIKKQIAFDAFHHAATATPEGQTEGARSKVYHLVDEAMGRVVQNALKPGLSMSERVIGNMTEKQNLTDAILAALASKGV